MFLFLWAILNHRRLCFINYFLTVRALFHKLSLPSGLVYLYMGYSLPGGFCLAVYCLRKVLFGGLLFKEGFVWRVIV